MDATLVTIAKDVKIQIEFNPARVAAYRLIGYENRMLAKEDFNDDKKDAGEIGAGHTVTALYEVVPAGVKVDTPPVDDLKYQPAGKSAEAGEDATAAERRTETSPTDDPSPASGELLTVKLRYKEPDAERSKKLEFPLTDRGESFNQADHDFQFAASVAALGMMLRDSKYKGTITYDAVLEMAAAAKGTDPHGYRGEFLKMIGRAKELASQSAKPEE
jgi:Ca-activated chloride channel homolog